MHIKVRDNLNTLILDMYEIRERVKPEMRGIVRKELKAGTVLAKGYAKSSAGPHGKDYYKRISSEMTSGLGLFGNTISGEYGPTGIPKSDFVGVGFRHGHNTDLARSADIVGPSFLRSVDDAVSDWFW